MPKGMEVPLGVVGSDPAGERRAKSGGSDQLQARLELPCQRLGIGPPPATVHLRFLPHRDGWLVYLWNRDGIHEALLGWLGKHMNVEPTGQTTSRPRLSTCIVDELPEAWRPLVEELGVDLMVLEPGGEVRLNLRGPRAAIGRFISDLGMDGDKGALRSLQPATSTEEMLTQRQRDALLHAVTAGYFDVPRRVQLKHLADEMDMSEGALSELLRRAEGRVLRRLFEEELTGEPPNGQWTGNP